MTRLVVNDAMSQLGEETFWSLLCKWLSADFVGGDYNALDRLAYEAIRGTHDGASLIMRNCSYFPPMRLSATVPTISLLQDIFTEGPMREMQESVIVGSAAVVFNSSFTHEQYRMEYHGNMAQTKRLNDAAAGSFAKWHVIPLPVDFSVFEPQNAMGCQQALSLPDGCVCWIGACDGAAGHVKGWDIFLSIVRGNPDIPFVAVFKDRAPDTVPPNMRAYVRLAHEDLAKVIGACKVGLCTSRIESQHLAGIEMGACGLPLVVPNTGTYWNRENWPGATVLEPQPTTYTNAIRALLTKPAIDPSVIRDYWKREFDRPVIRAQWAALVEEVECSGPS